LIIIEKQLIFHSAFVTVNDNKVRTEFKI